MGFNFVSFFPRAVMQGIPLLFGSTGEILTEKSGNLNLGIPGIMYVGGISGVIGAFFYEQGAAQMNGFLAVLIPILCSLLGSLLMGLLYCFLTVTLRANQNVTGLAMTTFGVGVGNFFGGSLIKLTGSEVPSIALSKTSLRLLPLGEARFETFRFDLYDSTEWEGYGISPRANMERNFDVCRDFACQFSRGGGDLLLSGGTGLGKTFLSACIARVVSESGFSVVYDTAISIFAKLENDKFRPDEETAAEVRRCESCDLLILDDLGTEMTTSFVQSALYQMVNGRMIAGRSTIISTNLAPEELGQRYGAAILSRIEGGYEILPFFGEDIRRKR